MTEIDLMLVGCGVMAERYLVAAEKRQLNLAVVETPVRLEALRERFPGIKETEAIENSRTTGNMARRKRTCVDWRRGRVRADSGGVCAFRSQAAVPTDWDVSDSAM